MRAVVDFGVGGMASVAITRKELDSVGLRAVAGSSDAEQARRLLSLAMVLDGHPRRLAAQAGGMDRQPLRDWVHRYIAHGVQGLRDVRNMGRAPAPSAEQMQELENLVLAGPNLKQDGVVRWRCADLRSQIKTRFAVALHERTVGKLLRHLGMTRLQPRPYHPKADPAAQQAYKKLRRPGRRRSPARDGRQDHRDLVSRRSSRGPARHSVLYLGAHGSRPARLRGCRRQNAYLLGAICPARAVGATIIMRRVGSEALTLHLAEISK